MSWSVAGFHQVRSQTEAARLIANLRREIAAAVRHADEPRAILVSDLPTDEDMNGVATYGDFLGYAFAPPFESRDLHVRSLRSMELLVRQDYLYTTKVPVQVLRWTRDEGASWADGYLEPVTGVLPIGSGPAPRLEFTGEVLTFDPPLAPRDVRALALELAAAPTGPFEAELEFRDPAGATTHTIRYQGLPVHGSSNRILSGRSGRFGLPLQRLGGHRRSDSPTTATHGRGPLGLRTQLCAARRSRRSAVHWEIGKRANAREKRSNHATSTGLLARVWFPLMLLALMDVQTDRLKPESHMMVVSICDSRVTR